MKTCTECGAPLSTSEYAYRYKESGLPLVLEGITIKRCAQCGEEFVALPRLAELHREISRLLVSKSRRLAGAEVRWLRDWLGLTGARLGNVMGVTASSVSRWENDREPIGGLADRFLRSLVLLELGGPAQLDTFAMIRDAPALTTAHLRFDGTRWTASTVAEPQPALEANQATFDDADALDVEAAVLSGAVLDHWQKEVAAFKPRSRVFKKAWTVTLPHSEAPEELDVEQTLRLASVSQRARGEA